MHQLIKLCLTPLALAMINVGVADDANWNGYYYGASLNQVHNSNKTTSSFGNDAGTPTAGWVDNQFHGDLLNTIDSMDVSGGMEPEISNTITLSPINNNLSSTASNVSATILAGKNIQFDHIVLGGEVKLSFGNFGAKNEQSVSGSGNQSMSDFEGPTFSFTNYNSSITGLTSPQDAYDISNTVDYLQSISNQNSYKMNHMLSFAARSGVAYNQVLFYGLAGVAYAHVNAKTSLTVNESATGSLDLNGSTTDYTGSSSYLFSGENSKHMLGYTAGVGAEWAVKNDLRLRFEWDYYNLGKISTQGSSAQTLASYTVSQEVTGYNISIGLVRDF